MTENGVIVTGNSLPATAEDANWGAIEAIDAKDILVSKVYHQQAMSKFVADGVAKPGEFVDSVTGEVLGTKDGGLDVVVFSAYKQLITKKRDKMYNKWETESIAVVTPQNAAELLTKPFEEEIDGEEYKHQLVYNFWLLLPDKIGELPYVISLGSTKTKTAKKLNALLMKLAQMKKPGAAKVFHLSNTTEKNDQGQWFGLDVTVKRDSTPEELAAAFEWYKRSKSAAVTVAPDEDEHVGSGEASDEEVPF